MTSYGELSSQMLFCFYKEELDAAVGDAGNVTYKTTSLSLGQSTAFLVLVKHLLSLPLQVFLPGQGYFLCATGRSAGARQALW